MNDHDLLPDLERRLTAYYGSAEQPPASGVVWSRLAPALSAREPAVSSPAFRPAERMGRPRVTSGRGWQGLSAAAVAMLLVALFAGALSFALSRREPPGPAATPSAIPAPTTAPLDALSPDLAAYVAAQHGDMAVVVYDITRGRYYSANETTPFVLASSAKVYILTAYLDWVEGQGRAPTADETHQLTAMIEVSSNDAAQLLFDRLGNDAGMGRFLAKVWIAGYVACHLGWGCAQLPPAAMARMLTLLYEGRVLNSADRQLALDLLSHVEADQRRGVGDSAPPGATVYMQDGWVQWPSEQWVLNSSGVVSTQRETYILVIYSRNQPSLDWSKIQHVARVVAQLLT
jgi:beta-lactamase class A